MKKATFLVMLAGLMVMVGCKKENNDTSTPSGNAFSISANKKVSIATGNLQYQCSSNSWRIAPNAWDASKEQNSLASPMFAGWLDYFGWGYSGEDHLPYEDTGEPEERYHSGSLTGTPYDWGVRNDIENHGTIDPAGTWRTLSSDEWDYIINTRSTSTINGVANARYANATVADQVGIILFPDNPKMPEGVVLPASATINTPSEYYFNSYSADDWAKLEEAGCVFLPALGCKSVANNNLVACDYLGCYWTSSYLGDTDGDGLYLGGQFLFNMILTQLGSAGIIFPRCVRLAKDIK